DPVDRRETGFVPSGRGADLVSRLGPFRSHHGSGGIHRWRSVAASGLGPVRVFFGPGFLARRMTCLLGRTSLLLEERQRVGGERVLFASSWTQTILHETMFIRRVDDLAPANATGTRKFYENVFMVRVEIEQEGIVLHRL